MWINLASILVLSILGHKSASQQLGLSRITVKVGAGSEDGTDDDVRVQLSGGKDGETCQTGVIDEGHFYNTFGRGQTEKYSSSSQDFGNCNNFQANRSSVGFSMVKGGTDGLDLKKVELHFGSEVYVWEGHADWDPSLRHFHSSLGFLSNSSSPSLTAVCTTGNCRIENVTPAPPVCPNTGCPIANIRVKERNGTDRLHCYFNGCPRATGTTGQDESGSTCVQMNRDLIQYKYCCNDPNVDGTQDLPTCMTSENGQNGGNGQYGNGQNGNGQNGGNGQYGNGHNGNGQNGGNGNVQNGNGQNGNGQNGNGQNGNGLNGNGLNGNGQNGNGQNGNGQNGNGQNRNGQNVNGQNVNGQNDGNGQNGGQYGNGQNGNGQNRNGQNGNGQNRNGQNRNGQNYGNGQYGNGQNRNGQNGGNGHNGNGHNGNGQYGNGQNRNGQIGNGQNRNGQNGNGQTSANGQNDGNGHNGENGQNGENGHGQNGR